AALKKWHAGSAKRKTPLSDYLEARNQTLLTIDIGSPKLDSALVSAALGALLGGVAIGAVGAPAAPLVGTALVKLLKETIFAPGYVVIDANYIVDGTEIFAGYAGLAHASGFKSIYGHRAKIDIGGVIVGNYLPAAYLLGLSGYVNPVGPVFIEFRCGVVIP